MYFPTWWLFQNIQYSSPHICELSKSNSMLFASNLCQAPLQYVLVQRQCCARSDKTSSLRVWYYTPCTKACVWNYFSPSQVCSIYCSGSLWESLSSILVVTKPSSLLHFVSLLCKGKKNCTVTKNKMKYHRGEKKRKASHTRQLRKRTKMKPMETGSMFSFQNKGWRNKLWTEGGYWEMTFSVTQVTRKKEPQQQLRFKMTTHEKTWKNTVLGINGK